MDNIQVGGRNLIIDSGTFKNNPYLIKEKYQGNSVIYAKANVGTYLGMYSATTTVIPTGKEYIVSFYAKADDANTSIENYWYSPNTTISAVTSQGDTSNAVDGGISLNLSKNWTKYWIKWTQKEGEITNFPKHLILGRIYTSGVYLSSPMLSEGNRPLDWTAAPEDNATVEALSSIESTVNGIQNTVASKADESKVAHNVKSVPTADGAKITAE